MEIVLKTQHSALLVGSFNDIFKDIEYDFDEAMKDITLIERPPIVIYGKPRRQNRDIGFYSNQSVGYQYSGQLMSSQPLTEKLASLLQKVNQQFRNDTRLYNGILINRYNNGLNSIGKHSDDEKSLAPSGVISVSFGATRKFRIRAKYQDLNYWIGNLNPRHGVTKKKDEIIIDVPLVNGMVAWMQGNFQSEFTHEIPKEAKVTEPRISLTFRSHTI